MKTTNKNKSLAYREIVIQDEGGIDIVRVTKQIWKALYAEHLLQLSAIRGTVKLVA
jgi:hypothetical protein